MSIDVVNHNIFYNVMFIIILGVDVTNKRKEDAGPVLSDRLRQIMQDLEMPDGLTSLGYTSADIPALVKGTLPQVWINKLLL